MNTTANINYLASRQKAGFDLSKLSEGSRQAFDLVADTTENFTSDFDLIDEDPNAVAMLDKLVKTMKASAGPGKPEKKTLTDKQQKAAASVKAKGRGVKSAIKNRVAASGKSFTDRMNRAKAAKAETKQSSEDPAQSTTTGGAKKPRKAKVAKEPKPKAAKAKGPDKQTAAYLTAKHVKHPSVEVGLIRTFIGLTRESTKEKIVAALSAFQKSFHAGKWDRSSPLIDQMRAIQKEYLDVLNAGKAPYKVTVSDSDLASYVAIVGGEKVYASVRLLNKFVGWTNTAKNEKQIHLLLSEAKNAVVKGKIDPKDPYADKIGEIIHVLEKAKAGQPFKAEATALSGLAGTLGCSCHQAKPLAGTRLTKMIGKSKYHKSGPEFDDDDLVIYSGNGLKYKVMGYSKSSRKYAIEEFRPVFGKEAHRILCAVNDLTDAGKFKMSPAKKKAHAKPLNGLGSVETAVAPKVAALKSFPGLITSEQIMRVDYPKYTFAQPWGKLFGEPQTNANVMVWGEPGQGKSTFGFKLARYLATSHGPVLYVSSEEIRDGMPSFTIKKKLDMAGGSVAGWDFAGDLSKLSPRHKFLIVDSVNDSKMTRENLKTIKKAHPNLFVILIFQATKEGKFKGENDWSHDVDVVLEVADGQATTTKNRFAELTTIKIF